ncbi:MAG: hypothetical protein HUJ95_07165 [Bacteroidales bacterium]|nr:hypothetical protein [Bacteroidales bacterium]
MKKIYFIIATMVIAAVASCQKTPIDPEKQPDGKACFESIVLRKADNSFLEKDYSAIITADSLLFALPDSLWDSVYVASFKLSKDDTLYIDGAAVKTDKFEIKPHLVDSLIAQGKQKVLRIVVKDEKSVVETKYGYNTIAYDEEAALTYLAFRAADNKDILDEDVVAAEIVSKFAIEVPGSAIGKNLTAKIAATVNDEITVNGQKVGKDSTIVVDSTFPVDIVVKDLATGLSASYVLSFCQPLTYGWLDVAKIKGIEYGNWFDFAMGEKYPYIAYLKDQLVDETIIADVVGVVKYDRVSLKQVGPENITGIKSSSVYLAVDSKDVPYIFYNDYNKVTGTTTRTYSVQKFENNAWSVLGSKNFAAQETGIRGLYKSSFEIDHAGYPFVAFCSNAAVGELAKRDLGVCYWDGSDWASNKKVSGRTKTYCYSPQVTATSDATYVLAPNQNEKTFDIYKFQNKGWTTVVDNFGLGGSDIGTVNIALHADAKGTVYALLTDNVKGPWTATIYKIEGNTLVPAFNTIPGYTFNVAESYVDFTFDINGNPIVALVDDSDNRNLVVIPFNKDTKNWGIPVVLGSGYYGRGVGIGCSTDGEIYVAAFKWGKQIDPEGKTNAMQIDLWSGTFAQ